MAGSLLIGAAVILLTLGVLLFLRRLDSADPEAATSPVPWLSDDVWAELNPQGFLARRALLGSPVVTDPDLIEVTDDDRRRAPTMPDASSCGERSGLWPRHRATRTRDDHVRDLLATPGSGSINSAVWPLCCAALAMLIWRQGGRKDLLAIEARCGALDMAFLEGELASWGGSGSNDEFQEHGWHDILELMRRGDHSGEGMNIFQCRGCARLYVASCGP